MKKNSIMLILLMLIVGCSSGMKSEKATAIQPDETGKQAVVKQVMSSKEQRPSIEERLPYPYYVHNVLRVFTDIGIDNFYALNKHVPASFEEYVSSGIPMLIPNDYVTGEVYRLVDSIDINDTTGFTFTSDGIDTCAFEFVIKNNKTNSNQIHAINYSSRNFEDIKSGIRSQNPYYFDKVKREYSLQFFTIYGYVFLDKHNGTAPSSLVEMLKDEGELIETGWKWAPDPASNEYFEYGIDAQKLRCYHIQTGKNTPPGEMSIAIQQMHAGVRTNHMPEEGVDRWSFSAKEKVSPDVIEMNKYISSDAFYQGYLQIKG